MILQFTTGSVEDRMVDDIQIAVQNAGIQAANVICTLRMHKDDEPITVIEETIKIYPQEELVVLEEGGLKDAQCEVLLTADSPSLIVTILAETRHPIHCQMVVVDDIDVPPEILREAQQTSTIFWGYARKGKPF